MSVKIDGADPPVDEDGPPQCDRCGILPGTNGWGGGLAVCDTCLPHMNGAGSSSDAKGNGMEISRALFDEPQATTDATGPAREEVPGTGGLCYRTQAVVLFSDRGAGKSMVAKIIGLSAAVNGERVYYFDRENGAAMTRDRIESILDANDWTDVLEEGRFVGRHYPRLDRDWDPDQFGEAIADRGFTLVIYDSLREAISQLGGDSNSDADISCFIDLCVTPLVRRGIAVLILDNTGHEAKNRPKGSGSKLDAIPQAYKVKATEPFTEVQAGRVELTCTRSRSGDVDRRWTARVGDGTYEVPAARDEAPDVKAARKHHERREEFRRACVEALREQAPRGRDDLISAVRERGVKGRNSKLRRWLQGLAADPSSGLVSGPDGYALTPGPEKAGHPGATPPEGTPGPTPSRREGGPGPGPGPWGHAGEEANGDGADAGPEEESKAARLLGVDLYDDNDGR
ncbi:MAG: AAA family ATPase [bacterium]